MIIQILERTLDGPSQKSSLESRIETLISTEKGEGIDVRTSLRIHDYISKIFGNTLYTWEEHILVLEVEERMEFERK